VADKCICPLRREAQSLKKDLLPACHSTLVQHPKVNQGQSQAPTKVNTIALVSHRSNQVVQGPKNELLGSCRELGIYRGLFINGLSLTVFPILTTQLSKRVKRLTNLESRLRDSQPPQQASRAEAGGSIYPMFTTRPLTYRCHRAQHTGSNTHARLRSASALAGDLGTTQTSHLEHRAQRCRGCEHEAR
jgi:hypothetical protein